MKILGLKILGLLISIIILSGCNQVKVCKKAPFYSVAGFSRLDVLPDSYSKITFAEADYETSSGSIIKLTSCVEVENTDSNILTGREFSRYMYLVADCYTAKRYYLAKSYEKTFFPNEISPDYILSLPALTVVDLSGQQTEEERGKGKSLLDYDPNSKLLDSNNIFTRILTQGDLEIDYYVMVRGDFNNDNIEDIILKTNWRITSAFGEGAEVITITKKSKDAKIEIIDRFWTFWP